MILVNDQKPEMITFPDGTPLLRVDTSRFKEYQPPRITRFEEERPESYEPVTITWKYDNDGEIAQLMYITKHLRSKGIKSIVLDMPYIPNARFDRVKKDDEVFTLKYFAEMINSLGFEKVNVLDAHSYVSEALIDRVRVESPENFVRKALEEIPDHGNLILYFPDEGAMKRYSELARKFHLDFAFGVKQRDWRNGNIIGTKVEGYDDDLAGKQVLIIDDICSKGGTFYYSAKALKEKGAGDVYLYVSHCENAILEGDMIGSGLVKKVFTTDSIYRSEHDLIKVLH